MKLLFLLNFMIFYNIFIILKEEYIDMYQD